MFATLTFRNAEGLTLFVLRAQEDDSDSLRFVDADFEDVQDDDEDEA